MICTMTAKFKSLYFKIHNNKMVRTPNASNENVQLDPTSFYSDTKRWLAVQPGNAKLANKHRKVFFMIFISLKNWKFFMLKKNNSKTFHFGPLNLVAERADMLHWYVIYFAGNFHRSKQMKCRWIIFTFRESRKGRCSVWFGHQNSLNNNKIVFDKSIKTVT